MDVLKLALTVATITHPRLVAFDGSYLVSYESNFVNTQVSGLIISPAGAVAPTAPIVASTSTGVMADTLVVSDISVSCPARQLATIRWGTNKPSDSRVEFGKDIYYGGTAYGERNVTEHEVKNIPVDPDVTYHYRIRTRTLSQAEVLGRIVC